MKFSSQIDPAVYIFMPTAGVLDPYYGDDYLNGVRENYLWVMGSTPQKSAIYLASNGNINSLCGLNWFVNTSTGTLSKIEVLLSNPYM